MLHASVLGIASQWLFDGNQPVKARLMIVHSRNAALEGIQGEFINFRQIFFSAELHAGRLI